MPDMKICVLTTEITSNPRTEQQVAEFVIRDQDIKKKSVYSCSVLGCLLLTVMSNQVS